MDGHRLTRVPAGTSRSAPPTDPSTGDSRRRAVPRRRVPAGTSSTARFSGTVAGVGRRSPPVPRRAQERRRGFFFVGDPDTVYERIFQHYHESGGYGVLLLVLGKDYGTRAQRARSLKLFNSEIVPRLRGLDPDRDHATAPAS